MLERWAARNFHETIDALRRQTLYEEEIHTAFDLERAGFLKISQADERKLVAGIAFRVIRVSDYLKIPTPEIGLIHGWDEYLPGYDEDPELSTVLSNAVINEKFPNGLIRFSPFYIKSVANFLKTGEGVPTIYRIEETIAHEVYHLWQIRKYPNQTAIDSEVFVKEGVGEWNKTITETKAREFAHGYIQNFG